MIIRIIKWILAFFLIPIVYLLISLILTYIPIDYEDANNEKDKLIYISTNGVHLDIIIPKNLLDSNVLIDLKYSQNDQYLAFGWGDKNFYLNTPTWADLTFNNAFQAVFLKGPTLVHLTRYTENQIDWVEIKVNQKQLHKLNKYIFNSFYFDSKNQKVLLNNKGYFYNDDFYEAIGNFTCFKTCNSWVNSGLKKSEIKSCLWTPFDFGLIGLHKK